MAGLRVEVGDGLTATVRPGPGPRILWIHGYTLDSTVWGSIWAHLPDWHHVGLDLPGHGGSRALRHPERLNRLGRILGSWASANDVRHLVALSFGTIVALQVAIEYPQAFTSLTLGAPALAGGPQDDQVAALYGQMLDMYRLRGPGIHLHRHWTTAPTPLFACARQRPEAWPDLDRAISRHSWSELAANDFQALMVQPQRSCDLRTIGARTLLLVGEHEMPAFRRCAELIRRSVPACTRIHLAGLGHLCMLEAPSMAAPLLAAHLGGSPAQYSGPEVQ